MASSTPSSRVEEIFYHVSVGKEILTSKAVDLECTFATREIKPEIDRTDERKKRDKRIWSRSDFTPGTCLILEYPDNERLTVRPNQEFIEYGCQRTVVIIKPPPSLREFEIQARYGRNVNKLQFSCDIKQDTVLEVHGNNACLATPMGDNLHNDSGNGSPETMDEINAAVGEMSLGEQTPTGHRTGVRPNRVL